MKKVIKYTVIILLLLSLSASTAYLAYLHYFAPHYDNLSGQWTARVDMSGHATSAALAWLQDIEAVSPSWQDMEAYMQDLEIQVELKMEQTADTQGTFRCRVSPESYEACNQAAYEGFAAAFRDLAAERLRMAGYTGSMDQEAMEALVAETFGMPTVSYLMNCVPALLPSLEELQAGYDGSGTYEAVEGVLTRQYEDELPVAEKTERYILTGTGLVLSREPDSDSAGLLLDRYPLAYTLKRHGNP